MKICPYCGAPTKNSSFRCKSCGKKLQKNAKSRNTNLILAASLTLVLGFGCTGLYAIHENHAAQQQVIAQEQEEKAKEDKIKEIALEKAAEKQRFAAEKASGDED